MAAGGDAYAGEWHSDMRWGKGVQKYADGETYTGDWLKDVRHGDGKASVLGAKYEGEAAEYESEARALRRELQAASLQHESQVKAMEAQAEKELRRAKSEAAKLFAELATQPPARPGPTPSIYGKAEGGGGAPGGGASIYQ